MMKPLLLVLTFSLQVALKFALGNWDQGPVVPQISKT